VTVSIARPNLRPAHEDAPGRQQWRQRNGLRSGMPGQRGMLAIFGLGGCVILLVLLWLHPLQISDLPLIDGERADELLTTLDVNAATTGQLAALPGIGPARAVAIVADREVNGPFEQPSDLQRVPGIGPVLAAQMTPHLRFE
jgi:competence ComEA-like helix-hairpin-helix protein